MRNRSLCLLLGAMGFLGTAYAVDPALVTIEFKDSTKKTFSLLTESPIIQYRNDSVVVTGAASTAYLFDEVHKYYFNDGGSSGLHPVASNEVRVSYLDNQNVLVEGLSANSQVGLFSILGQKLAQRTSVDGEPLQLVLPDAKGVYVLRVNEQSIKLIKE